jgi:hypothetical protein
MLARIATTSLVDENFIYYNDLEAVLSLKY